MGGERARVAGVRQGAGPGGAPRMGEHARATTASSPDGVVPATCDGNSVMAICGWGAAGGGRALREREECRRQNRVGRAHGGAP